MATKSVSEQFRARISRAQSARALSGLNRVETPIGCHLSDIDPNSFGYPIISPSSCFLTAYVGMMSYYDANYPRGVPAHGYMGFINHHALPATYNYGVYKPPRSARNVRLWDLESRAKHLECFSEI